MPVSIGGPVMPRLLPLSLAIVLAVLSFGATKPAYGQSTCGELVGQVFDPSGKTLYKAKVTIKNIGNANTRSRETDKNGYYLMPCLPPGNYRITASKETFLDASIAFSVQLNQKNIVEAPDITLGLARIADVLVNELTRDEEPSTLDGEGDSGAAPVAPAGIDQSTNQTASSAGRTPDQKGRAQLVHTKDAALSSNFTLQQMNSLPLGGAGVMRTFDELALLVAGVSPPPYTPGVRGPGVGFGIGTAGEFSVNGMRARSNNFSIDGSDNNDPDVGVRRQGFVALVPQSIESINDFSIATLLWDAELGRNFGSQVNAVSRYGENEYHGQAYVFFTDSRLNARNAFDYSGGPSGTEDPFTRAQAGLTFGGRIVRNRTQFFSSVERQVINNSTEQHFSTPRSDQRRFLGLSRFIVNLPPGILLGDKYGVLSGVTPLGRNILSFYPLPNNPGGPYGTNTYTEILPADGRGTVLSFRLTHQVSARNALNARYNFTDDDRVLPTVNRAIRSTIGSRSRSHNLSLILDSEITDTLFNQARFSFGQTRLGFPEHPDSPFTFSGALTDTVETPTGPRTVASSTGPIGELLIEPFSPVGVNAVYFPQQRTNNTFQYADTASRQLQNHSLKFGADIRRVQLNSLQDRFYRPQVVFGNGLVRREIPGELLGAGSFFSGVELAALGQPSSILQTITAALPDSSIRLRVTEYDVFINDNWRLTSNLTLDFGLRYEYNTAPKDADNRIEDAITVKDLPSSGASRFDSQERTEAFDNAVKAYQAVVDGRTRIYDPDRNNFGPHFGLAWDPWKNGKTSIRAGYGIYYDAILGAVVSQSRNVFPREIPVNIIPSFAVADFILLPAPSLLNVSGGMGDAISLITPGTLNRLGGARGDFVALVGDIFLRSRFGGGLAFTLPDRHLRTPYAQQWHLTVEREVFGDLLIAVSYVGTKGNKLTRLTTPNLGPIVTPTVPLVSSTNPPEFFPNFGGAIAIKRPNRALGPFQIFDSTASSKYHALRAEARKRYSQGYSFTLAYTFSHAIDDVSDLFPIAGAPVLAQNQSTLVLERADANFDVRHQLATSFIWDLPFFRSATSGARRWLGGWQLAAVFQFHTGQPFTLNLPVDANLDGNLTDRPLSEDGLVFFEGHGARRVAISPGARIEDFFRIGADGFTGRNTARGDGFSNLDIALNKTFRICDNQEIEVRAEIFNSLNRSNFGIPIRTLGAPAFGSAVDTSNPARIIQFALKYRF